MVEWKSVGHDGKKIVGTPWNPPKDESTQRSSSIVKTFQAFMGFLTLIAINAFAAFSFLRLAGVEIAYWRCVLIAIVYVIFRTYDKMWVESVRETSKKM